MMANEKEDLEKYVEQLKVISEDVKKITYSTAASDFIEGAIEIIKHDLKNYSETNKK